MKFTAPAVRISLMTACLLALAGCSFPSATAGGGETNAAVLSTGVYQESHMDGWISGDQRRIDTPEEINFGFWTRFWKMSKEQQIQLFNTFSWPAVHAFVRYGMDKWDVNEAGSTLDPDVRRLRWLRIIDLLDHRYHLGMEGRLLTPGMQFLIRAPGAHDSSGTIEILDAFIPRGLKKDPLQAFSGQNARTVIYEDWVLPLSPGYHEVSRDEMDRILALFP